MNPADTPDRRRELHIDRVLTGLSPAEERELADLGGFDPAELEVFERTAATLHLGLESGTAPLPDDLRRRILATAPLHLPSPKGAASGAPAPLAEEPDTGLIRAGLTASALAASSAAADERPMISRQGDPVLEGAPTPAGVGRAAVTWGGWLTAALCLMILVRPDVLPIGGPQRAERTESAAERRRRLLEAPDTRVLAAKPPTGPAAELGDVAWNASRQEGYLRIKGVPGNVREKTRYQLWIFDKNRDERYPVDGGVFDVAEGQEAIVEVTAKLPVGEPTLFAITEERPDGVVVSDRSKIVWIAAPEAKP